MGRIRKKCSKCGKIRKIAEFPKFRKGSPHEYQLSYCWPCRRIQIRGNLNTHLNAYLTDRFRRLKVRCRVNAIPFNLTKKFFIELFNKQKGLCFYTSVKMRCRVGHGYDGRAASIDRVNPSKGYTKNNVVFCTARINKAKSDFSVAEMKKYMPRWYKKVDMWRKNGYNVLSCQKREDSR